MNRNAALSEAASPARRDPSEAKELFDLGFRHLNIDFADPRHNVTDVQEEFVREKEIDPDLYYPEDVKRELIRIFPKGFKIEIPRMVAKKVGEKIKGRLGRNSADGSRPLPGSRRGHPHPGDRAHRFPRRR